MALFRFEAKIIGRRAKDKAGKPIPGRSVSVVAKAAYRAGEKLYDERNEKTYNYRSRAQEVVHDELVMPDERPSWLREPDEEGDGSFTALRETLWNHVEAREKRVDSQLAREFVIALPSELSREQQVSLIRGWCAEEISDKGFVADLAIHRSRDGENPHAHVLCTLRPFEGEDFGNKPDMTGKFFDRGAVGGGAKSELQGWRTSWETHCNAALEQAGLDIRVDHRSLAGQGIDREPEPKIGVEASAMQRRGAVEDPDRVREARQVRMRNALNPSGHEIAADGEVPMDGENETTWSARIRSGFTRVLEEAKALWHDESSGARSRPAEPNDPASNVAGNPAESREAPPVLNVPGTREERRLSPLEPEL